MARPHAICVVGGLRTYAMPAVSGSIHGLAHRWEADLFYDVHTAPDTSASHLHTQRLVPRSVSCAGFSPLGAVHTAVNEATRCHGTAARQLEMISRCFLRALAHAPYRLLARVRPDFFVAPYTPLASWSARPCRH